MSTPTTPRKERVTAAERQTIREAYVQGHGSLLALALRHAVPLSTVQRWSATEHWVALRREAEQFRLGKLCPSQTPRFPMSLGPDSGEDGDVMERRRAMGLGVVEEQIRLLLEQQKKTQDVSEQLRISSLLGELSQRLLRMDGLIPRPPKAGRTVRARQAVPIFEPDV